MLDPDGFMARNAKICGPKFRLRFYCFTVRYFGHYNTGNAFRLCKFYQNCLEMGPLKSQLNSLLLIVE